MNRKTVFILGAGSGIGIDLAMRYHMNGFEVIGTYRNKASVSAISDEPGIHLLKCDIRHKGSIERVIEEYDKMKMPWNIFISSVGSMEPINNFFTGNFDLWEESVICNSLTQLRFLHGIFQYRNKENISNAVFFAGGGTNSTFTNYSAYCVSKILLIKMCELLDDENKDLNVFIVGPGWVRTKIHEQTINNPDGAGYNYGRTVEFLESGNPGTPMEDIYDCISWCIDQGKETVSGRNFSVVHDVWKRGGAELAEQLRNDPDKFKLRRFKNIE